MFLLQVPPDAAKAVADASAPVAHHAGTDPFTALLWLGLVVFAVGFVVVAVLYHRKLTAAAPVTASTPDALSDLARRLTELADLVHQVADLKTETAVLKTKQEHTTNILEQLVDLQEHVTDSRIHGAGTQAAITTLRTEQERQGRQIDDIKRELAELRNIGRPHTPA